VNRTGGKFTFDSCDSRIPIVQEARDGSGKWRAIEDLPKSWCGNSYYGVTLPAKQFWEFTAPAYTGTFKTKLRFVLQGEKPIYSNAFDGSVNPGQFTEKQDHEATNLMEPYLE